MTMATTEKVLCDNGGKEIESVVIDKSSAVISNTQHANSNTFSRVYIGNNWNKVTLSGLQDNTTYVNHSIIIPLYLTTYPGDSCFFFTQY